jgi:hypothetical protein
VAELSRKYAAGGVIPREAVESDYMWIFELVPR